LNVHNQITDLSRKYATNPATADCFKDMLGAWLHCIKQLSDQAAKQRPRS